MGFPRWSIEEEEVLRATYARCLTENIARSLGRSAKQVSAKANAMGLKKSPELLAEIARQRVVHADHGSVHSRFVPGQKPWNAGTKGLVVCTPAMARTQFRPGNKPHTWVPVGSFRLDPEGYLQVKYSDEPGSPTRRWKGVHRHVWEQANGPMPAGHIVVFKPGRRTADLALITLDAVELITRAENLARNSIHNLPPELLEVTRLRASLTRAINNQAKEAEAS